MPFFKLEHRLVYYAHVPKCGGSSIAAYIENRFGQLAFHNDAFLKVPADQRWTKTSPQHANVAAIEALFPTDFFDAAFAVVRHPVSRLVSAYHFQKDLERTIPGDMSLSDWLKGPVVEVAESRFDFDNHLRPMAQLVPENAAVFHLEHGIDALVPWFDWLAGSKDGPRAIPKENERGAFRSTGGGKAKPTSEEIDQIAKIYAVDFERFGYDPHQSAPLSPAPEMTDAAIADRDAELRRCGAPHQQLKRRLQRKLRTITRR